MKFQLVKVWWVDICEHTDEKGWSPKDAKNLEVSSKEFSVGYLIRQNKDFLWLGNNYTSDDDLFRFVMVLPMSVITKVTNLVED